MPRLMNGYLAFSRSEVVRKFVKGAGLALLGLLIASRSISVVASWAWWDAAIPGLIAAGAAAAGFNIVNQRRLVGRNGG